MRAITSVVLCSLLVLGGCGREDEQTGAAPGEPRTSDQGAMEPMEPMDEPGRTEPLEPREEPAPMDR